MKSIIFAVSFSILLLDRPAEGNPDLVKCSQTVDVGSPGFKNHGTVNNPAQTCYYDASSAVEPRI
jgi:hypothetical protein